MKIAFIMSNFACVRPIKTDELFTSPRGLTGSEMSFLMTARGMAKLGHDVTIYSNFTHDAVVDGIPHLRNSLVPQHVNNGWNVAAAWIDPNPLAIFPPGVTKFFDQQVNDFGYCRGWEGYVDIFACLAHEHRRHLSQFTNFSKKWTILPNAANTEEFSLRNRKTTKNRRMVYASSPDRGLHLLLEAYPQIRRRVPDVTLDVYYAWKDLYAAVRDKNTEIAFRIRYCMEMFDRLKPHGVTHYGSASREKIKEVFSSSRLLAYTCSPVSFTEGFSVTTLEAALAGCVPVLVGSDALAEIYTGYVPVVPAPYKHHKQEYIDTVVELLTNDDLHEEWQQKSIGLAEKYNWDAVSLQMHNLLTER